MSTEREFAKHLAFLIDEATPYRTGQASLMQRAMWVRRGPGRAAWALLVIPSLIAFALIAGR